MAQFSETLSEQEKIARFQLIRTENIGPIIFRQLIEKYKSAEKVLETIPELAKRGWRKKPFITYPISKILKEIEQLDKLGGTLIVLGDKAYPRLLSEIEDAPPVLMALGNIDLFENQNFAIVGARNASAVGLKIASRFSQEL